MPPHLPSEDVRGLDPSLCDTERPLGTIVGGMLLFRFPSGSVVQGTTGSLQSGLHKPVFLQILHQRETLGWKVSKLYRT